MADQTTQMVLSHTNLSIHTQKLALYYTQAAALDWSLNESWIVMAYLCEYVYSTILLPPGSMYSLKEHARGSLSFHLAFFKLAACWYE